MHALHTESAHAAKARSLGTDAQRLEDLDACRRFLERFVLAPDRPRITYSVGPGSRVTAHPLRRRFSRAQLTWAAEEWAFPHPSRRIIDVETMELACDQIGLKHATYDGYPGVHIGEPRRS